MLMMKRLHQLLCSLNISGYQLKNLYVIIRYPWYSPRPLEPLSLNPSPGDSKEVAKTSVQPIQDTPPTDNLILDLPQNDILRANARQRSQPSVPSIVTTQNRQSLVHFILCMARADTF